MIFGIRGNTSKPELTGVVSHLLKELDKKQVSYLIDNELAVHIKKESGLSIKSKKIVNPNQLIAKSDFLVSIGGDGTFLESARLVGDKNIPVIGVNLGKLGFLAETATDKISAFITDITKGKYKIEERTVLSASSKNSKYIFGMNEIVINQTEIVKTILIEVYYNEQLIISYHGDGLIVATPTGSTGYSLSAGGPIVSPVSNVIIVSPMCPHTLTARPIIVPDNGAITIKVNSKVPVIVTADGNQIYKLKSPASIEIKKALYNIKIVKSLDSDYFKVLNQKLYWGADKRNTLL